MVYADDANDGVDRVRSMVSLVRGDAVHLYTRSISMYRKILSLCCQPRDVSFGMDNVLENKEQRTAL